MRECGVVATVGVTFLPVEGRRLWFRLCPEHGERVRDANKKRGAWTVRLAPTMDEMEDEA